MSKLVPLVDDAGEPIVYTVKRTRRKSLGVYVYPDRRVQFRAPLRTSQRTIEQYIAQSQDWIGQQLSQLPPASLAPRLEYIAGEDHPYLGELYSLAIEQGRPQRVELSGQTIHIRSLYADRPEQTEKLLKQWYRQQAQLVFEQRLHERWTMLADWQLPEPSLRLRWMKSRWGSCSRAAVITLNVELLKYPLKLIDYVIVHELCHLLEFNHSPRFYALMDKAMPDWRERKQTLGSGLYF